jgi:hypothetical protein
LGFGAILAYLAPANEADPMGDGVPTHVKKELRAIRVDPKVALREGGEG